jgi:hypothetical protein
MISINTNLNAEILAKVQKKLTFPKACVNLIDDKPVI